MAGFHGRSGNEMFPMHNHNVYGVSSDYELALQQQQQHGYDFQADLDMFTNTQFFDFDMGEVPETNSPTEEPSHWKLKGAARNSVDYVANAPASEFPHLPGYFPGNDLAAIQHQAQQQQQQQQQQPAPQHPQPAQQRHHPAGFTPSLASQHHPHAAYPAPSTVESPSSTGTQQGEKRKAEAVTESGTSTSATTPAQSLEEASRAAAEEDKRRRNTAASARFRVKKKQREQALEKTAKEMTDRVQYLEQRVTTLEMENKLLKDLITEKSGKEISVSELSQKMAEAGREAANAKVGEASEKPPHREIKIEKAAAR